MYIPLTGFAPDAHPQAEAVVLEMSGAMPTTRGIKSSPAFPYVQWNFPNEPRGGAIMLVDGVQGEFYALSDNIYRVNSSGNALVAHGAGYSTTDPWWFAQWGGDGWAINPQFPLQRCESVLAGSPFAAVSGAPKGTIVVGVGLFLFIFNADDGTNKYSWWCSAQGNGTSWTPSIATQAANGPFVDSNGFVTAAAALGDQCVAYGNNSIHVGTYEGPPRIWNWRKVPGEAGAESPSAVCPVMISGAPAHFVVGRDNFWLFDGSRPVPVGNGVVRDWFFGRAFSHTAVTVPDTINDCVHIFFTPRSDVFGSDCLIYNYRLDKWGRGVSVPKTTHALQILGRYNSPSNSDIVLLTGAQTAHRAAASSASLEVTTSFFGAPDVVSRVSRVRPRFHDVPIKVGTSMVANCSLMAADSINDTATSVPTYQSARGLYWDMRSEARWHQVKLALGIDCEVLGVDVDVKAISAT